jgi:mannosyl-oligosaccharide alpha-1,2-mannosidase
VSSYLDTLALPLALVGSLVDANLFYDAQMNSLRDPFSLRNKTPLQLLRTPLQTLQTEVQGVALPVIGSAVETLESMSFSIPKNVPSFTSPNREFEDVGWAAANSNLSPRTSSKRSVTIGNITQGAVGGLFGKDRDLPLYKDKPYYQSSARNQRKTWRWKRFGGVIVVVLGILYWLGLLPGVGKRIPRKHTGEGGVVDWDERREKVKDVFLLSWNAYEKHAWGKAIPLPRILPHFVI